MKRLSLAELVASFHQKGRWQQPRYVPKEQSARLEKLFPALERLHSKFDVHSSGAFVDLAYRWTGDGATVENAQKGLEFLAQQAEEAAQNSGRALDGVAGFLELRNPWRAAGGKNLSPNGAGKDYPDYGGFMMAALSALQALPVEQRSRYMGIVKLAVETEIGTGSRFTEGSLKAVQVRGIHAVELYARTAFEWLNTWRSSQKAPYHATNVGREVLRSMWYFMSTHKDAEKGAQKLGEHLVELGEVAEYVEHNFFFLTQKELMASVYVPANKVAIWHVFREISDLTHQGDSIGYRMLQMVNSVTDFAKFEKEEEAVKFAKALRTNYVATLAMALERSNGKPEGRAADLLDNRNAETIYRHLYDRPFWESLVGMVNEVPAASPGSWVPNTETAAASFLQAVRGPYFEAEKALLVANAARIAEKARLTENLAVLELGMGNGEKLAAMLRRLVVSSRQLTVCGVDSNSVIAAEGLEGIVKGLNLKLGSLHFAHADNSVEANGRLELAGKEIPVQFKVITEYFEQVGTNPAFLEFTTQTPDYFTTMLGTTFGNFEPEKAGALLKKLIGRTALIGLHLYNGNDSRLMEAYDSPDTFAMAQNYLRAKGVQEEDLPKFEHVVEIRKRNERVAGTDLGMVTRIVTYMAVKPDQQISCALQQFGPGDVVKVGLSIKYTDEQAQALFTALGFNLKDSYQKGSAGLYLVEHELAPPKAQPVGR